MGGRTHAWKIPSDGLWKFHFFPRPHQEISMLLSGIEGLAFQDERKSGLIGSEFDFYNEDDDNDESLGCCWRTSAIRPSANSFVPPNM
jgi:hypothetical protein